MATPGIGTHFPLEQQLVEGLVQLAAYEPLFANGSVVGPGERDAPVEVGADDGIYVHGPALVLLVLLPFFGRFVFDYVLGSLRQRCGIEVGPEFRTCIDRPFVQLEIRAAVAAKKNVITVFEEERRRPAFFDYSLAWEKYGESEFKFLLDIDSVTYRRDAEEAQAMLRRILKKACRAEAAAPPAARRPINGEAVYSSRSQHFPLHRDPALPPPPRVSAPSTTMLTPTLDSNMCVCYCVCLRRAGPLGFLPEPRAGHGGRSSQDALPAAAGEGEDRVVRL